MCRFVAYHGPPLVLADLITRPTHSIIHQSYHAKERVEPLNGDGFGVAWYTEGDPEPALFKDVSPAWNDRNLINIARVVESRTVMAHVRAATQGLSVMRANCHPFGWGKFAWMHNGNVGGFQASRRAVIARLSDEAFGAIGGTTDSEHAFGIWIDAYREAGHIEREIDRMRAAMATTLDTLESIRAELGIDEALTLNFAVTDGDRFVATRAVVGESAGNTLYYRVGHGLRCEEGVNVMDAGEDAAVLVASEPLFDHDSWGEVPMNSMLSLDGKAIVEIRPR